MPGHFLERLTDWFMERLGNWVNSQYLKFQAGKGIFARFGVRSGEIIVRRSSDSHGHTSFAGTLVVTIKGKLMCLAFESEGSDDQLVRFSKQAEDFYGSDDLGRRLLGIFRITVTIAIGMLERQIARGGSAEGNFIVPFLSSYSDARALRRAKNPPIFHARS